MEKASRALRRSGVKILSMGGANTDLSVTLSEVKNMRNSAKAFMTAQNLASRDMLRWAAHEENRAIQDVINQVSELNLLWTEVQSEFLDQLKEYRQMFEMILSGEKQVFLSKQNYNICDQKEMKYRKELSRAVKKGALESERRSLHTRIIQAEQAKDLAYSEFNDRAKENECIKLIRLKSGLLKVSEAYIEMSTKCSLLFTAQRDVVLQLPDVHGRTLDDVKYTGRTATVYAVEQARNQIKKYRRYSNPGTNLSDPPPPYTPPDSSSSSTPTTSEVIIPIRNTPPPAPQTSISESNTPPSYEQANTRHRHTDDPRRLGRHSLPTAVCSSNIDTRYGSLPSHSTTQTPPPTQEYERRRSETLPRTGSAGRITPRYPAPPVPQPSRTMPSTGTPTIINSEKTERADRLPVAEVGQRSCDNFFMYGPRDVATQSQNETFQSSSLYSSVRVAEQAHVCPSGLPSPSVQEYIDSSAGKFKEKSPTVEIQSENVRGAGTTGDDKDPASGSDKEETQSGTENLADRGTSVTCEANSESTGSVLCTSTCSGISESGSEMTESFKCLHETTIDPLQEHSKQTCSDEFQNIPYIDSVLVDLSPTLSLNDLGRNGSVWDADAADKTKDNNANNRASNKDRKMSATDVGDSADQGDVDDYDTAEEEENVGAVGGSAV